jgi:prevent-host-death family protein
MINVQLEAFMAKETIMTFVEARAKLSTIVDRVNEQGETYIVVNRQKPLAVIIGIDKYRHLAGAGKHVRNIGGKRIFKVGGIAKAVGDVDEAIRALRKSR